VHRQVKSFESKPQGGTPNPIEKATSRLLAQYISPPSCAKSPLTSANIVIAHHMEIHKSGCACRSAESKRILLEIVTRHRMSGNQSFDISELMNHRNDSFLDDF
jgi:hypothetical protein